MAEAVREAKEAEERRQSRPEPRGLLRHIKELFS